MFFYLSLTPDKCFSLHLFMSSVQTHITGLLCCWREWGAWVLRETPKQSTAATGRGYDEKIHICNVYESTVLFSDWVGAQSTVVLWKHNNWVQKLEGKYWTCDARFAVLVFQNICCKSNICSILRLLHQKKKYHQPAALDGRLTTVINISQLTHYTHTHTLTISSTHIVKDCKVTAGKYIIILQQPNQGS